MLQRLFFQVGHIGPMAGQLWYFKVFAPEKIPLAIIAKQAKKGTFNVTSRKRCYGCLGHLAKVRRRGGGSSPHAPSGEAGKMRMLSEKSTKTPRRFAGSLRSLLAHGIAG